MRLVAYLEGAQDVAEQRGSVRRTLRLEVVGSTSALESLGVTVHDLSATGLLVETEESLRVGDELQVELPEAGAHTSEAYKAEVVWASGRLFGCKFSRSLSRAAMSAAQLKSVQPVREQPAASLNAAPQQTLQGHRLTPTSSEPELAALPDRLPDRLPIHIRLRILLGLGIVSLGIWMAILWAVGLF